MRRAWFASLVAATGCFFVAVGLAMASAFLPHEPMLPQLSTWTFIGAMAFATLFFFIAKNDDFDGDAVA